jgi:hypothetical protein
MGDVIQHPAIRRGIWDKDCMVVVMKFEQSQCFLGVSSYPKVAADPYDCEAWQDASLTLQCFS